MASGLLFIILGSAGLIAALMHGTGVLALLGAWAAVTLVCMGVAYGFLGPALMGKRSDGRIAWYGWFLFWPFHLFNWMRFRAYWALTNEAPWHQVAEGIYIGRALMAADESEAERAGVRAVLDLTAEFEEARWVPEKLAYRCAPLLDTRAATAERLNDLVAWLEAQLASGAIYVHCAMGHGRSALVVSALLVARREACNADEAIARIKAKRPFARLHASQRRAIEAWIASRQD
jgi:hypothetical protein